MNRVSAPFTLSGGAAIIAGGLLAAAIAYQPTEHRVWTVAYLVLVVGVVQYVIGAGQGTLATRSLSPAVIAGQWTVLNFAHLAVIAGTLLGGFGAVVAGTALYAIAMIWFLLATRGGHGGLKLIGYRILLLAMLISSLIGLFLSAAGK